MNSGYDNVKVETRIPFKLNVNTLGSKFGNLEPEKISLCDGIFLLGLVFINKMTDSGSNRVVSHSKDLLDVGKKSTVLGKSLDKIKLNSEFDFF